MVVVVVVVVVVAVAVAVAVAAAAAAAAGGGGGGGGGVVVVTVVVAASVAVVVVVVVAVVINHTTSSSSRMSSSSCHCRHRDFGKQARDPSSALTAGASSCLEQLQQDLNERPGKSAGKLLSRTWALTTVNPLNIVGCSQPRTFMTFRLPRVSTNPQANQPISGASKIKYELVI